MPRISDNKAGWPVTAGTGRGGESPPAGTTLRAREPSGKLAGSSFAARFGRVILRHGIAAIPSALYHFQGKLGLTAQQVWFISYILSHKWDEDLPYPSIAQMARCTGISDRMLRYRCNELHHLGYLEIFPRYSENGGQSTNYYDFANLFARLEGILSDEAPRPNPIQEGGAPPVLTNPAQTDSSFLARYGRVLLSYGVAAVPRAVFTHQKMLELTAQQVWFICYVLSFQWDTSLPYPSINKMAERTGYSKQQLHNIKGELVLKGYLHLERRRAEGGGNDTNLYDFSGLFDAIREQLEPSSGDADPEAEAEGEPESPPLYEVAEPDQGVEPSGKRRHRASQPKHARGIPANKVGSTDGDHGTATGLTRRAATQLSTPTATQLARRDATGLTREIATGLPTVGNRPSPYPLNGTLPDGRKVALPKVEAVKEETKQEDDSNQRSQKNRLRTRETNTSILGYSPYIAAVAQDFSRELEDSIHEVSNMKQALNLWQSSGLSEQEFVDRMQEARKLTRRYQSRPTWDSMNNKMAYYFTTLRDLLGEGDEI